MDNKLDQHQRKIKKLRVKQELEYWNHHIKIQQNWRALKKNKQVKSKIKIQIPLISTIPNPILYSHVYPTRNKIQTNSL